MDKIHHLDSAVVVQLAIENVPSRGSHESNVRQVLLIVVNLLELFVLNIREYLCESSFHLTEEH